jgi:hypothetical protein
MIPLQEERVSSIKHPIPITPPRELAVFQIDESPPDPPFGDGKPFEYARYRPKYHAITVAITTTFQAARQAFSGYDGGSG